MRTFDMHGESGRLVAFKIRNGLVTMWVIRRILSTIPDVRILSDKAAGDNKLRFSVNDHVFVVCEPWSDSSRSWIGPEDMDLVSAEKSGIVGILRSRFQNAPWTTLILPKGG